MIHKRKFQAGLHALGLAFNREITADVMRVFDGVLSAKLDDEAWERAVQRCLESERFFPAPATLLRFGMINSDVPITTLAADAYDKILDSYFGGVCGMTYGTIKAELGRAAADAFLAAGGHRAFSWCEPENEPFRWKAFKESFVESVEAAPALALPAGPESVEIGPAEAKRLMDGIKGEA